MPSGNHMGLEKQTFTPRVMKPATNMFMREVRSFWVNVWALEAHRRPEASQILRTLIFLFTSCMACFIMVLAKA